MIHRIGRGLVIGTTLTRHVAAGVTVTRKFGEAATTLIVCKIGRQSSLLQQSLHAQPINKQFNPAVGG